MQLPLFEVLETAKRKLSSVSACLNDSTAFSASVAEFDEWLTEHGTSSPVQYERFANTMTDVYMAKLDGMEGTPAVRAVRKRVIAQIEQLAVGSL